MSSLKGKRVLVSLYKFYSLDERDVVWCKLAQIYIDLLLNDLTAIN